MSCSCLVNNPLGIVLGGVSVEARGMGDVEVTSLGMLEDGLAWSKSLGVGDYVFSFGPIYAERITCYHGA